MAYAPATGKKFNAADFQFFADIGFTTGEMASALGMASVTVRKWSRIYGVKFSNKPSAIRRFHKSYQIVSESGCWIWTGTDRGNGYGCIMVESTLTAAHRFSFELYKGPIPDGHVICHACDVPSCVNPAHLWSGTHKDNAIDKCVKGRANSPRGIDHHAAKITEEVVKEIRAKYNGTSGQLTKLAREYGVAAPHMHKLVNGKLWAWL